MKALFAAAAALLVLALYLDRPVTEPRGVSQPIAHDLVRWEPSPLPVARLRPAAPGPRIDSVPAPQDPALAIAYMRRVYAHGTLRRMVGGMLPRDAAGPDGDTIDPALWVMTGQVYCPVDDRVCLRKLAHHWCSVEMPSSYRCRPGYDFARVLGAGAMPDVLTMDGDQIMGRPMPGGGLQICRASDRACLEAMVGAERR